jgi:hypothetical protein
MAAIASCSARQCLLHLETFKATLSVISAKESMRPISPPSRSRVTSLVLLLSGFLDNVLVGSLRLPFFLLYSTTSSPLRFVRIVGYVFLDYCTLFDHRLSSMLHTYSRLQFWSTVHLCFPNRYLCCVIVATRVFDLSVYSH